MGVAFYIILEGEPNAGTDIVGKAIAHAEPVFMDRLAQGKRSLSDYVSATADEMAEFFDDESEMPEIETKWFDPQDGLQTLADYEALMRTLDDLPNRDYVAEDLAAMRKVLEHAKERGERWRLGIDF